MTSKDLKNVLEKHKKWLRNENDGEKADLSGANLRKANLREANLSEANLSGANLSEAKLDEAENIPYIPMICPEEGSFIGYKKVKCEYIVKLLIPAEAKRSSATSRKCRCEFADVLEIVNFKTGETIDKIVNDNYTETIYETGKRVYPDSFDNNRWNECSNGIHFFINRKEAEMY